jgi:hypothetical protein
MSEKRRVIKYLKPNVIRTASNLNKNVSKAKPPIKTVTTPADYKVIPLANEVRSFIKPKKSRVFVIGGGASLIGFDFSKLEGEDIIAVNKSIEHVKRATYFITMDYTFITDPLKLTEADFSIVKDKADFSYFVVNTDNKFIKNINGVYTDTRMNLKYSALSKFDGVITSDRAYNISTGFSNDVGSFAHGNNSGYCGLQLAILLGYDEIYLLGYDLNVNSTKTHFHSGYRQNVSKFSRNLNEYRAFFAKSLQLSNYKSKIFSCSNTSYLNTFIKQVDINSIIQTPPNIIPEQQDVIQNTTPVKMNPQSDLKDLIIVGYYTVNTPYEKEAEGLIHSCNRLNLRYDIPGVPSFGSWQSNTRFKAKFMLDMLLKYPGQKLLYVDCDAVIHKKPELFKNFDYDIGVRYQDFSWRKNECLSGTIFMHSNERTIELCKQWMGINDSEGANARTLEQWNLDKAIQTGIKDYGLRFCNLPPEYTFIFDSMKRMYPGAIPIIEHFQASRRFKNKV